MFEKWKSLVISLFNGAIDSSAVVPLFFKVRGSSGPFADYNNYVCGKAR